MASIDRPTAGGNSGPIALRTEVAPMPGPAVGPLGYSFDAVPRRIRHNPRLKPVDAQVVAILIGFAVWRRDSCWASVASIASRLPAMRTGRGGSRSACDRTVQRSIDRLKAEGELRHERVPKPDPDDPRNRTGWRFYFNWIAPQATQATQTEVTKGPAEVTKPGGEVTKESGDSLVTQARLEVLEQDSTTFNVAALASGGEEAVRVPVSLPTPDRLPGPDTPALSPPAPLWSDAELAEKLVRMVRAGGCDLKVEMDPERGEVIRPTRALASEVIARLKRLRPHVLAYLKRRPGESAPPAIEPDQDAPAARPAARVRDAGRVRALIGALPGHPGGGAAELATGRAIAGAIGDDKPKSVETFAWYAGEVRRGDMPLDWLMTAFERACSRKARNRGKVLVATIQQLKDGRAGGRGRPPVEGGPW